jgi:hypothetical protein
VHALDCAASQRQKLASVRQQHSSLRVMHRRMNFRLIFAATILFGVSTAHGHEAIFSWTYTTDLTPKGHGEFEQWITTRWEKAHGTYSVIDFREEFEYGVTDNFQLAIYLNHHYVYANDDVPVADPAHPKKRLPGVYETGGEDVHAGHNPAKPFDSYHFESVSLEGIYRLLSPYKDPIGLALYFEPSVGDQETELEWKILLQKNWLEDRLVWALNVNYELEYEKAEDGYERDSMFEWFTGLSYRFVRNWSAGLEFWNHHEFADATAHEHSAYFLGPTIHYGGERWWATLGFLHQLPIGQAFSQDNKEFAAHDGYIFGDEHEKYYVRFKVGINF